MAYMVLRDMNPFSRLLVSGFIVLVTFILFQVIAITIAIPVFGLSQVSGMFYGPDLTDPGAVNMLKYFQVCQSLGLFIAPSLLIALFFDGRILKYLYLVRPIRLTPALIVVILVIVINPFINFTGALNAEMQLPEWLGSLEKWMRNAEDTAERLTEAFLKVDNIGGLLFNLFMIAVLPAFGEEMLFRGVIQKLLTQWSRNPHWGIWLSAILFSALHMQFYGFVPRMLLAGMFGYLLHWSGSLRLPILAHFVNNAGAVIALFLIDKGVINPSVEEFGAGIEYWYFAVPSLTIGIIILRTIRFLYANNHNTV